MRGRTGSNVKPIETCNACEIRNVLRVDMIVLCRLHAAAPTMREALEAFISCIDDEMSGSVFDEPQTKARAALALATGKDHRR